MHDFEYKQSLFIANAQNKSNRLYCENIPIETIAKDIGTPFYLYSYNTLCRHYKAFSAPFGSISNLICYSIKANSNLAVIKTFLSLGSGIDVVSKGELYKAIKAGAAPKKIVFSGVGKTEDEIEFALKTNILMFNVESEGELYKIEEIARQLKIQAGIALRVNPDIDPQTHPYISTGLKENKFGININDAEKLYYIAKDMEYIDVLGIDCHIGSQLVKVEPFIDALDKIKNLIQRLKLKGINIKYFDIGGGLGITYDEEEPPHPKEYGKHILEHIKDLNCTLILEPGRVLVGNAGILVTKVLYLKKNGDKNFIIVDGAMNDLIRPSLYGSYQNILPINKNYELRITNREDKGEGENTIIADVVGPICESGDFFAKNRSLVMPQVGDLLAIMSCGAYGFSMSSNYNSRLKVPEIMGKRDQFFVIRKRESLEDLIKDEINFELF